MDEADAMTTIPARRPEVRPHVARAAGTDDDWVAQLRGTGPDHDDAVRRLHELLLRSARHQVARMPAASALGQARREEIVLGAADEATVAVLARLDSFEGRSRFTTWAYKFGLLHAAVEVRRAAWQHRQVDLASVPEPVSRHGGPEAVVEAAAFTSAVAEAMRRCLTDHQRRVALALLVDGVPVDVLADRLGSNRNAVYKTLHDARVRLRAELTRAGYLGPRRPEEVAP